MLDARHSHRFVSFVCGGDVDHLSILDTLFDHLISYAISIYVSVTTFYLLRQFIRITTLLYALAMFTHVFCIDKITAQSPV